MSPGDEIRLLREAGLREIRALNQTPHRLNVETILVLENEKIVGLKFIIRERDPALNIPFVELP